MNDSTLAAFPTLDIIDVMLLESNRTGCQRRPF